MKSKEKYELIFGHRGTLSDDRTNAVCEGKISKEECLKSLTKMKNDKSPGSDGLRRNLKVFSGGFGDDVVQSISNTFNKGDLSICQKRGIITLLPKKDKPTDALNNLSPVTLLNVEDKIGTKGIPKRLAKILREIVSPNQTGYLRHKYIGENVRVISDVIEITLAQTKQEELQLSSTLRKPLIQSSGST